MEGAGDCERGVGADVFCGGPLDQADLVGSWVGIFCAVAVEDLLIEFCKEKKRIFPMTVLFFFSNEL